MGLACEVSVGVAWGVRATSGSPSAAVGLWGASEARCGQRGVRDKHPGEDGVAGSPEE